MAEDPISWGAIPAETPSDWGAKPSGGDTGAPPAEADKLLGPGASSIVRPLIGGLGDAIAFVPDMVTDAVNLIPESVLGPKSQRPSDAWNSIVDQFTTKPKGYVNKAAEWVSRALVSGGGTQSLERGAVGAAEAAASSAPRITTRAAQSAVKAGYKLSPSYIGGDVTRTLQEMAGGPKANQEFSKVNEAVTDRLAAADLGLAPDAEIEDSIPALKEEAYAPYQEARRMGRIKTDPQYQAAVDAAGGRFAQRGKSFGGSRYPEIDQERIPYRQTDFDVADAVDEMRMLRNLSRQNLKQYNPTANAVGYTQREIANALEDQIERAAKASGNPDLVDRLRAARVALSKISAVEDSLGAGGHVRADDLRRMLESGKPLTGGLRTIAETSRNFRKDLQAMADKGEKGYWSAVDYLLGGTGLVEGMPAIAGLSLARPVTRWGLRTGPVQRSMMRGLEGQTNAATQLAGTAATGAAVTGYESAQ